jgi:hypothetical protein
MSLGGGGISESANTNILTFVGIYIIFTSPIGGANKKEKACKNFTTLCLFGQTLPIN